MPNERAERSPSIVYAMMTKPSDTVTDFVMSVFFFIPDWIGKRFTTKPYEATAMLRESITYSMPTTWPSGNTRPSPSSELSC